jgi:hypothetical protein
MTMCMCAAVLPLHTLAASSCHRYCGGAFYCGARAPSLEWEGTHVRGAYISVHSTTMSGILINYISDGN